MLFSFVEKEKKCLFLFQNNFTFTRPNVPLGMGGMTIYETKKPTILWLQQ